MTYSTDPGKVIHTPQDIFYFVSTITKTYGTKRQEEFIKIIVAFAKISNNRTQLAVTFHSWMKICIKFENHHQKFRPSVFRNI